MSSDKKRSNSAFWVVSTTYFPALQYFSSNFLLLCNSMSFCVVCCFFFFRINSLFTLFTTINHFYFLFISHHTQTFYTVRTTKYTVTSESSQEGSLILLLNFYQKCCFHSTLQSTLTHMMLLK